MEKIEQSRTQPKVRPNQAAEPDVMQHCPNCGHTGQWQKCKLICDNPKCSIHIILACVD